jgi:hypothetical protein
VERSRYASAPPRLCPWDTSRTASLPPAAPAFYLCLCPPSPPPSSPSTTTSRAAGYALFAPCFSPTFRFLPRRQHLPPPPPPPPQLPPLLHPLPLPSTQRVVVRSGEEKVARRQAWVEGKITPRCTQPCIPILSSAAWPRRCVCAVQGKAPRTRHRQLRVSCALALISRARQWLGLLVQVTSLCIATIHSMHRHLRPLPCALAVPPPLTRQGRWQHLGVFSCGCWQPEEQHETNCCRAQRG